MNKAKYNYWIDVSIGISFVLSAVSGLIFLLPVGTDSSLSSGVLGVSLATWNHLHTWSSLGLMAGVLAHLVLHWKWIVAMTKKMLPSGGKVQESATPAPGLRVSRRQFLSLGLAALATGVIATGYAWIAGAWTSSAEQSNGGSDLLMSGSEQQEGVACPRGLVNDPYPGRCRRYRDSNGDGICDYSVPGSGVN